MNPHNLTEKQKAETFSAELDTLLSGRASGTSNTLATFAFRIAETDLSAQSRIRIPLRSRLMASFADNSSKKSLRWIAPLAAAATIILMLMPGKQIQKSAVMPPQTAPVDAQAPAVIAAVKHKESAPLVQAVLEEEQTEAAAELETPLSVFETRTINPDDLRVTTGELAYADNEITTRSRGEPEFEPTTVQITLEDIFTTPEGAN